MVGSAADQAALAGGSGAVDLIVLGLVAGAIWVGYLAWFCVLIVRRLRAPELRSAPPGWLAPTAGPGESPAPLWRRLGVRVGDAVAVPVLLWAGGLAGIPGLAVLAAAVAVWMFAPAWVGNKVVPLLLVGAGANGFILVRAFARGDYGAGNYGLAGTAVGAMLPEAFLLVAAGAWLAWHRTDRRSAVRGALLSFASFASGASRRPRWGILLVPLAGLLVELFGRTFWLGHPWWNSGVTLTLVLAAAALAIRAPAVAGDLAVAGLILFGLYGVAVAAGWPNDVTLPSPFTEDLRYGLVLVTSRDLAVAAGLQGLALIGFGVWLAPRAVDGWTRSMLRPAGYRDLSARVAKLTRTRADAVDSATAQLRRLERDLHDGAQARLVALGMSLRAAERMIPVSPEAAAALVAEARETSLNVLDELRALVRGICPPVLADRGLVDAVRALALDTPLHTEVDADLPGRPDLTVETACYFAVAEALANAVKHSSARTLTIRMDYEDPMLRITVTDDGIGGADPALGSGLAGLERRLGTFDGVLAVSSPPGGPTIVAIEVPCALSSQKISTS
jgi:signal transduction histidine kinase